MSKALWQEDAVWNQRAADAVVLKRASRWGRFRARIRWLFGGRDKTPDRTCRGWSHEGWLPRRWYEQ